MESGSRPKGRGDLGSDSDNGLKVEARFCAGEPFVRANKRRRHPEGPRCKKRAELVEIAQAAALAKKLSNSLRRRLAIADRVADGVLGTNEPRVHDKTRSGRCGLGRRGHVRETMHTTHKVDGRRDLVREPVVRGRADHGAPRGPVAKVEKSGAENTLSLRDADPAHSHVASADALKLKGAVREHAPQPSGDGVDSLRRNCESNHLVMGEVRPVARRRRVRHLHELVHDHVEVVELDSKREDNRGIRGRA
eukprot:Amastigsp_a177406_15.p2 type:complete len:250 gc:universal Amastigsp_a177406_15:913-164(-)